MSLNIPNVIHRSSIFAICLLFIFLSIGQLVAQDRQIATVNNEDGSELMYPWAGGMNAVQFGAIDLNRDGLKDLLAFDRHGNRKMCFINSGFYDKIHYRYKPEFASLLPDLIEWAIFKDYDGDGRTDIFTYSPESGGMIVYRNISENILKFDLVVYPYLLSYQFGGYVNLLVTNVDYPGIADIDFDGDLDILSFWGLGSFVNYHKNMSMEKYGHADSLDFELTDLCWGKFAESEESNTIYLDTCISRSGNEIENTSKERHIGSTFLLLDLDQDTVLDLLLGDVDFPGIFSLHNGGAREEAYMIDYDTNFPDYSEKINLFAFPSAANIDVNNDNKNDLLVSPFDPSLISSENKNSVWFYQNTGANDKPFFHFQEKDFLQSEMIDRGSGAYPVLFDWDGDGLLDLFIGNYGFYQSSYYENSFLHSVYKSNIGYYKNTGSELNPRFQLIENDFADLSKLSTTGLAPTFDDLDQDTDIDILAGDENGKIILVLNQGNNNFEIITEDYFDIDVGKYSTPQLFDLDKDGLMDLIIGEEAGNLNYYQNTGSLANPIFNFVTDSLGKVNVTDYSLSYSGYSVPWFFRLPSGETQLLVGSEQGEIFYFTNIDGNLDGAFTKSDNLDELLDTTGVSFDRGIRTGASIADISKDGKLEMIVGNYSGGLEYFNGNPEVLPGFSEQRKHKKNTIQVYPNPASDRVTLILNKDIKSFKLEILNLNGKVIYVKEFGDQHNNQIELNVTTFKNGLYFLKATSEDNIQTGKLIIHY